MNAGTRRPARKLADIFMIKLPFSNLSVIQEKLGRGERSRGARSPYSRCGAARFDDTDSHASISTNGFSYCSQWATELSHPTRGASMDLMRARLREAGPQVVALSSPTPSRAAAARGR